MRVLVIGTQGRCFRLSAGKAAMTGLSCTLVLLTACGEPITVPPSDSTPPTVSMSIDFTNRDENRETLTLTPGGNSASRELSPTEPVAVLASGEDDDGGVKSISINITMTIFCIGEELGESHHLLPANRSDARPGQTASTVEVVEWTFDPTTECPDGVDEITAGLRATAENFHGGTATTRAFSFTISQAA
jgi:hypothetical protein